MRLAALSTLVLLAACAAPPSRQAPAGPPLATSAPAVPAPDVAGLAQQIDQATELARLRRNQDADRVLREIVGSAGLAQLDSGHRHQALLLAGILALMLNDPQRALPLLKRASELPEAGGLDWYSLLMAANWVEDGGSAATALVALATRWPQVLPELEAPEMRDYHEIERALNSLDETGTDTDRYTVLTALLDTHFDEEPEAVSYWSRDLALLQLARGESAAAVATLARVTDIYVVVSIEADNRFDPIRNDLGAELDFNRKLQESIVARLRKAQADPSSLGSAMRLIEVLRRALRFAQALQVADTVIEREESEGSKAFADYDREYVWILNGRAYALFASGRWDAAITQMDAASRIPERGDPNVSHALNLAMMYAELGRPSEALAAVERAGRANAYGDTFSQAIRLKVAVQLNNEKAVNEALKFLSDHRRDSLDNYQEALLDAGHDDEGAKLLISRLADPRLRFDALLAIQEYGDGNLPPVVERERQRWRALIARRDVQKAIRGVGYVRRYALAARLK